MKKTLGELKEKLAMTTKHTMSAEDRSKEMESALLAEEKQQEMLHGEISQMSAVRFKRGNELHEMKLHKRHMDTEIQVQTLHRFLPRDNFSPRHTGMLPLYENYN